MSASVEGDDVVGAISAMMQLRSTRAALVRVEAPLAIAGDLAELAIMSDVVGHVVRARAAEVMMESWLARTTLGDAHLLASPLGVAVIADLALPAVWDFETDLVVLVGAELDPVAEVLADIGQKRIVVVGAGAYTRAIGIRGVEELAPAIRTLISGPPSRYVVRAYAGSDPVVVNKIADETKNAVSDLRIHRNTVHAFSRTWLEQGIANLPALAAWPSIADVGDAFAGMPMVIVAPGPSLKHNAAQLAALKGRAIITAFSHSLKPVLAAGVIPDLVITVDPQDVRYHFANCDLANTCVVNAATVHPSLFELPAERFLTLSSNSAIDDWIFDGLGANATAPGGGSVATSAFALALKWRCDPIVFVGLDLSFTGGEYYVATSSDGNARAVIDDSGVMRVEGWSHGFHAMKASGGPSAAAERRIDLPGWRGGTVPSSFMFAMFHRWFVERMKSVTGTNVYNCTEGGAFIEGMVHTPLAEVTPKLAAPIDVAAILAGAAARLDVERHATFVAHLNSFARGLRRARKLGKAARAEIASGRTGPPLEKLEKALAATMKPLVFASLLAQREVERADDVARRAGSEREYLTATAALMSTLDSVIEQLEPALTRALAKLGPGRTHVSPA
ncbi:MAG: 6-hydroxymethylpterin diphosphokinase MptE-like protein [Polyangiales bacterium]